MKDKRETNWETNQRRKFQVSGRATSENSEFQVGDTARHTVEDKLGDKVGDKAAAAATF